MFDRIRLFLMLRLFQVVAFFVVCFCVGDYIDVSGGCIYVSGTLCILRLIQICRKAMLIKPMFLFS